MKRIRRYSTLTLILTTILVASAVAQEPATPSMPPAPPRIAFGMIVTDGANKAVDTIGPEEIEVIQNKIKQKVVGIEVDQRPVDYDHRRTE
jgi:hypothetical protein